ncbi:MAG TPA: tetratricopeptide repeat protein [Polyangiaceae bacterium]|nr:tetratricopeptide repeat protein [Polyangiaceae bacterium]
MLAQILQASRMRLTGSVTLDGGRERVLRFEGGLLVGFEDAGRQLDPLGAIVPEARQDAFRNDVGSYVARLEGRRWRLRPGAKLPRRLLRGDEVRLAAALVEGISPRDATERGLDSRGVEALFFAAALCGRLEPARRMASGVACSVKPVRRSSHVISEVRVSRKPPRRSSVRNLAAEVPASVPAVSVVPPPELRRRMSHVSRLRPPPTSPSQAFVEANRALQHLDVVRAVELAERAVAAHPSHPDYRAFLAFAQASAKGEPAPGDEGHYADELATLDEICATAPRPALAHYYRARLLKRLRRRAEARADFARALELDPSNVDAARELQVRRRSSRAMPATRVG